MTQVGSQTAAVKGATRCEVWWPPLISFLGVPQSMSPEVLLLRVVPPEVLLLDWHHPEVLLNNRRHVKSYSSTTGVTWSPFPQVILMSCSPAVEVTRSPAPRLMSPEVLLLRSHLKSYPSSHPGDHPHYHTIKTGLRGTTGTISWVII